MIRPGNARVRDAIHVGLSLLWVLSSSPCRADQIDDFVRAELKRQGIPGAAIAVVRDGKITKAKGYGVADLDHNVPVTADTVFALASITKQFTATLIMILVEDGKVQLDDDIAEYLDAAPATWKGITVRHLLHHTGGLSPLGRDFISLVRLPTISTAQMYAAARDDPIVGKPGERWEYSDVGYFLLGMIIERASGMSYEAFLRERILTPLGMSTARMADLNRPYPNLAKGYTLILTDGEREILNIRRDSQRGLTSHYGLFGTARDLAKWDAALYNDSVINAARRQEMLTAARLNDGTTVPYGFGWNLGERNGYAYHYHSGITGTFIMRVPGLRLTVVVLTNLGKWASGRSQGADAYMLAHAIAGMSEPKFQWKPLGRQDPVHAAKAREAFEALSAGRLPQSLFAADAIKELSPVIKDFPSWYRSMGPLRRLEMVDRVVEGGETIGVFRFVFAKDTRVFAVLLDSEGRVSGFFPDG